MGELRKKEAILSALSNEVLFIFEQAKSMACRYCGVLNASVLLLTLLEKLKDGDPAMEVHYQEKKRRMEPLKGAGESLTVSKDVQAILNNAVDIAISKQKEKADLSDLAEAFYKGDPGLSFLENIKQDKSAQAKVSYALPPDVKSVLDAFGRNLNEDVKRGDYLPVIGRDAEIECILETLCRFLKNNPLILGRAGVGKTAVIRAVAERIEQEDVPLRLKDVIIYEVDRNLLLANVKYIGDTERRIKELIGAVKNAGKHVILFFDEIHTLFAAGGPEGQGDVANLLKAALGNNEITVIGATTSDEYYKYFVNDEALSRRFNPILLNEPDADTLEVILKRIKDKFEKHHKLKIEDKLLPEIITLSRLYIPQRAFPDKAIDLLDRSCAKAASRMMDALDLETVRMTVSEITGLPPGAFKRDAKVYYSTLPLYLKHKVFGQEQAINKLCRILRITKLELDPNPARPDGVFIFTGPSGTGKSEMVFSLAEFLFGRQDKVCEIDLSGYNEPHYIAKMIGSPPGYVGYGERGFLVKTVDDNPHSIIVFTGLESAHPFIVNFISEALQRGNFSDAIGRQHYLSSITVVFMAASGKSARPSMGFLQGKSDEGGTSLSAAFEAVLPAVDEIIEFTALDKDSMKSVTEAKLAKVSDRIKNEFKRTLEYLPGIVEYIAGESLTKDFGVFVDIFIKNELMPALVDYIVETKDDRITVTIEEGKVVLK
mgnify:CR=1 FL=1